MRSFINDGFVHEGEKRYQYFCKIHGNKKNVIDVCIIHPKTKEVRKYCLQCFFDDLFKSENVVMDYVFSDECKIPELEKREVI